MGGRRRTRCPASAAGRPALSPGTPQRLGRRGHTPHLQPPSSCGGAPPPRNPQARLPRAHTCSRRGLAGEQYRAHGLCPSMPPPRPRSPGARRPPRAQHPPPSLRPRRGSGAGRSEPSPARPKARPPGQQHVGCLTTSTSPTPPAASIFPGWKAPRPSLLSTPPVPPPPVRPPRGLGPGSRPRQLPPGSPGLAPPAGRWSLRRGSGPLLPPARPAHLCGRMGASGEGRVWERAQGGAAGVRSDAWSRGLCRFGGSSWREVP